MKKLTILFFIIIAFIIFPVTTFAKEYDFRKTNWGMSIEEVKKSELKLEKSMWDLGNTLAYGRAMVLSKKVMIRYSFIDNKLIKAMYILMSEHTNKTDFITDYTDFKDILTKKYGKPDYDTVSWKNRLFEDDYAHWGLAISMGHLVYLSKWETQDTKIDISLSGENHKINCYVVYSSKALKILGEEAKNKRELNDF